MSAPVDHDALPQVLDWNEESDTRIGDLVTFLLDRTTEHVGTVIARDAAPPERETLLDEILTLAPGPHRLLLAPAITSLAARRAAEWRCEPLDIIRSALAGEACLSGKRTATQPTWTVWGDAYLPPGACGPVAQTAGGVRIWSENEAFGAPLLPSGTVVDAFSPAACAGLPEIPDGDSTLTPAEYERALANVFEAYDWIEAIFPQTSRTFAKMVRVVVLRRDSRLAEFRAASSSVGIGRIVLRNPHRDSATVPEIVDGLVHESIHALLDIVELGVPFVGRSFDGQRVTSPWTGRALDLRTYIHACFVWYGLLRFWSAALNDAARFGDRAVPLSYVLMASRGFIADGGVVQPLTPYASVVAPGIINVIESMQSAVRDSA